MVKIRAAVWEREGATASWWSLSVQQQLPPSSYGGWRIHIVLHRCVWERLAADLKGETDADHPLMRALLNPGPFFLLLRLQLASPPGAQ